MLDFRGFECQRGFGAYDSGSLRLVGDRTGVYRVLLPVNGSVLAATCVAARPTLSTDNIAR